MRRLRRFVTLAVTFSCVALRAQTTGSTPSYTKEEQEVPAVNGAIPEATRCGDWAALDRLWASDVMFIGGDGRVWNKSERLHAFRTGNRTYGNSRLLDLSVRAYQDTAIVAFTDWLEGERDGRPFRSRSYVTLVFMKRDGRWQLVHTKFVA